MTYLLEGEVGGLGLGSAAAGASVSGGDVTGATVLASGTTFNLPDIGDKTFTVTDSGFSVGDRVDTAQVLTSGSIVKVGDVSYDVLGNDLKVHSTSPNTEALIKKMTDATASGDYTPLTEAATVAQWAKEAGVDTKEAMSLAQGMYGLKKLSAEADALEWSVTKGKWEVGMQVSGMVAALVQKGFECAYMVHKIGLEDKLATLAETKEQNQHELQMTMVDKESSLKDSAMKYDYKKAKLEASTEKYKSKLAADVKRAQIKRNSVRDLFFPRNNYYYGSKYA